MMPLDRSEAIRAAVDALVAALLAAVAPERADAPERLLSVPEAADALGIGRSRLYAELDSGRLRSLHVGRRRLVPSGAIGDYIRGDSKALHAAGQPAGGCPPPLTHAARTSSGQPVTGRAGVSTTTIGPDGRGPHPPRPARRRSGAVR
jgi:excisionase family DNA binding protein